MKYYLILLLLVCGANCLAAANDAGPSVIAVLEDYAETVSVEPVRLRTIYEPRIRGVFLKYTNGWKTMCDGNTNGKADECSSESARLFSKLFAFSGEYRYEVETTGLLKRESCCHDVGWLEVANIGHIGQKGDRLLKYSGWNHDPVFKPEPLTNRAQRIADPEIWKIGKHRTDLTQKTWNKLASMVGEMKMCVVGEKEERRVISVPWKNAHLEFQQQFVNRHGRLLSQARLSPAYFKDCKRQRGTAGDFPPSWPEFWLAIAPGSDPVIHLFKSRIGFDKLQLIEFGDFDGDGKTEGLFFLSGYNQDGYVLFHDNMTKQIKFTWGYH